MHMTLTIFLANQRRFLSDSAKKNYYEILGITSAAKDSDVKKAYLKASCVLHF
jgi:preprotein translocase subunit Sec63